MKMLDITNSGIRVQDRSFNVPVLQHGTPVIENGIQQMTGDIRNFPYSEIESFKIWRTGDMKSPMIKVKWKEAIRSKKSDALYKGDYEIYELSDNKDMEKGKEFSVVWTQKMKEPRTTYYGSVSSAMESPKKDESEKEE